MFCQRTIFGTENWEFSVLSLHLPSEESWTSQASIYLSMDVNKQICLFKVIDKNLQVGKSIIFLFSWILVKLTLQTIQSKTLHCNVILIL